MPPGATSLLAGAAMLAIMVAMLGAVGLLLLVNEELRFVPVFGVVALAAILLLPAFIIGGYLGRLGTAAGWPILSIAFAPILVFELVVVIFGGPSLTSLRSPAVSGLAFLGWATTAAIGYRLGVSTLSRWR